MSAALLAKLIEAGTPTDLIAEVALELGRAQAERDFLERKKEQDRDRQRRRRSRDVTGSHVTSRDKRDPPKNISTPCSVSDETGGEPPDPVKELFDLGVAMLKSQGHDERQARSIIGNWRKGRSPGEVVAALVDAKTGSVSNLVEWMPRRLNAVRRGTDPPSYLDHAIEQNRARAAAR